MQISTKNMNEQWAFWAVVLEDVIPAEIFPWQAHWVIKKNQFATSRYLLVNILNCMRMTVHPKQLKTIVEIFMTGWPLKDSIQF